MEQVHNANCQSFSSIVPLGSDQWEISDKAAHVRKVLSWLAFLSLGTHRTL